MSESNPGQEDTLQKFHWRRAEPKEVQPPPDTQPDLCRDSDYTFREPMVEGTRNTLEILSNNFSMGNTERIMARNPREKGQAGKEKYFLLDNVSFAKKSPLKRQFQEGNVDLVFHKKESVNAINIYSGKSQFSNSVQSSKSKILRTLKTSEKSKKAKERASRKAKASLSEFSNGKPGRASLGKGLLWSPAGSKKSRSPKPRQQDLRFSNAKKVSSSRASLKKRKTPKNCGKEKIKEFQSQRRSKVQGFSYSKDSEMFSSSKRNKSRGQNLIFPDKNHLIRAFEVGRKTPSSKKKLSLEISGQGKNGNSQQTRKRLSIHVEGEDEFAQLSRQYFSSRNSNVMEFKPFAAGKSSILKFREQSKQASTIDPKNKFSNFLKGNQMASKTPSGLLSKYLYKRKGDTRGSPDFRKKKGGGPVQEIRGGPSRKKPKSDSTSKLSSCKLASFFNKNNPKIKRKKLIANQKIIKMETPNKLGVPKKNSLSNISKRLSGRKLKIKKSHVHESLNENSMIHIQNRVDIETLINSKLVSSRSKNTFLEKPKPKPNALTQIYDKSDTSIIFNYKTPNSDFCPEKFKKSIASKMRLASIKRKKQKEKGRSGLKGKQETPNGGEKYDLYGEARRKITGDSKNDSRRKTRVSLEKGKGRSSLKKRIKSKSKKVVLRKSSKVIISTRKSSKTPDRPTKSHSKHKKPKKPKFHKIGSSLGKKSSLKCKRSSKLFEEAKSKAKFFKTQLKNSVGRQEGGKSMSMTQKQGLVAHKIKLFKNIKEKLTSSFKQKKFKINSSSRFSNVKSIEKSKSLRQKPDPQQKFKSQKKMCKLKLGSISPKSNLQSFRLRPYSKTPTSVGRGLKDLIKKWPKKRGKFKRTCKKPLVESVSCLEKSIFDSKMLSKDANFLAFQATPLAKKNSSQLKIANLFSKHELQKKIQKTQKENFSKFNLSAIRGSKSKRDSQPLAKQEKYKNLISIKFNLNKKNKESMLKTPKNKKKKQLNLKIKKSGMKGCFRKLETLGVLKNSGKKSKAFSDVASIKHSNNLTRLKHYKKKKLFLKNIDKKNQKKRTKFNRKRVSKNFTKRLFLVLRKIIIYKSKGNFLNQANIYLKILSKYKKKWEFSHVFLLLPFCRK